MDMIVRGSEYQSFLNCRKQWFYQWVEGIEPKRPDNKLFFGNAFHKWLESYYVSGCNFMVATLQTSIWMNEQDLSGMEQTEIDDLKNLLRGVSDYYHTTYAETDSKFNVLGTEVEFIVKLEDELFMTGTIDLIYEVNGKVRFMDHKTVASIQMYVDKSVMDRQISRYWWVLKMLSSGIARIKDKNGVWVRWNEIVGKEIDGFDYNIIAKDFPKDPKVLKKGDLSKDKSQRTTYDQYFRKIVELGLNENDYTDILEYLKEKPNLFLRRVDVLRTEQELEAAVWEFAYTAGDIHDVKLMIKNNPQACEALTYRNIGLHCMNMCNYRALCQTTIEGGNVSLTKNLAYKKREEM